LPRLGCLALASVLLLAACGSESGGQSRGEGARWRPEGEGARRPFDLSRRDFAVLTLPGAKHAATDTWGFTKHRQGRRFIVNLRRDSWIIFKRKEWRIGQQGIENLRRDIAALSRPRGVPEPPAILVRADRGIPWSPVRRVLELLGSPDLRVESWQFATVHPNPSLAFVDACLSVRASTAGGDAAPADVVLTTADGAVRVRRGATSWDFPPGDVFEDAARLAVANRHWDDLEANLSIALPTGGLQIEVGDEVPWAYVVAAIDCAYGGGVRDAPVAAPAAAPRPPRCAVSGF